MKKNICPISLATLTVFALIVGFASFSQAIDEAPGHTLFLGKKCNLCHSVDSLGIPKKSEKMEGADLSDAGNQVADAAWVRGWMQQTVLREGDVKHKKKWKGTDEELSTIADWVMTLKK